MKKLTLAAIAAGAWLIAGAAQATLIDRGGGMIYDTTRNITWMADMNYAYTSGYAAGGAAPGSNFNPNAVWTDGRMGWAAANAWVNQLVYGGYDDWRLPTLNPDDTSCSNVDDPEGGFPLQHWGTGCTGGELSGLFVTDLGNQANQSVLDTTGDTAEQIANLALFSHVQSDLYASGTVFAPFTESVWSFTANYGAQGWFYQGEAAYVVAVRDGDVGLALPEPKALALVVLALGLSAQARKRATA